MPEEVEKEKNFFLLLPPPPLLFTSTRYCYFPPPPPPSFQLVPWLWASKARALGKGEKEGTFIFSSLRINILKSSSFLPSSFLCNNSLTFTSRVISLCQSQQQLFFMLRHSKKPFCFSYLDILKTICAAP